MFDFFRKKIKDAFSKFSKNVDEEAEEIKDEVQEETSTETVESSPELAAKTITEKKPEEITHEDTEPAEKEPAKDNEPEISKEESVQEKPKPAKEEKPKQEELKPEQKETEKNKEPVQEQAKPEPEKEPDVKELIEKGPVPVEEKEPEKKGFFKNLFKKKETEPEQEEKPKEPVKDEFLEEEKRSFIGKISDSLTKKTLSEHKFNDLFWDLEIALLENNVAVEVVDLLKSDLRKELVDKPLPRSKIPETIQNTLKESVEKIFELEPVNIVEEAKNKKPYKILVVGINGSGKTTTIAKLCHLFKKEGLKTVVAASDTFRAAAIDQLEEHTNNLGVKLIKHDYGSDPAAVAFDAIKFAEAKKHDVVIIDTAGRLHSNVNLMDELRKVRRVSQPDFTVFIGESITGNDCVEQAKEFNKAVDIDGIILSKADIDEKGGAAISISYVLGKPILYLGVGQGYDDLELFDKYKIMYRMFGTDLNG
ncbi:MAG: signal recognition particle-docking protein FtsY [Candidatus Woesearchaeota archaeon]